MLIADRDVILQAKIIFVISKRNKTQNLVLTSVCPIIFFEKAAHKLCTKHSSRG